MKCRCSLCHRPGGSLRKVKKDTLKRSRKTRLMQLLARKRLKRVAKRTARELGETTVLHANTRTCAPCFEDPVQSTGENGRVEEHIVANGPSDASTGSPALHGLLKLCGQEPSPAKRVRFSDKNTFAAFKHSSTTPVRVDSVSSKQEVGGAAECPDEAAERREGRYSGSRVEEKRAKMREARRKRRQAKKVSFW